MACADVLTTDVPCLQGDFSGSSEEGGIKHALQLEDAALLNPVAYLNGLAKAITDKGGKIYEQTRVRKPDRRELETEAGNKVSRLTHPCLHCSGSCHRSRREAQAGLLRSTLLSILCNDQGPSEVLFTLATYSNRVAQDQEICEDNRRLHAISDLLLGSFTSLGSEAVTAIRVLYSRLLYNTIRHPITLSA